MSFLGRKNGRYSSCQFLLLSTHQIMKRENPSLKGTLGNVRSRRRRRRVKRSAFQTHKSFLVKKFCSEPEKKCQSETLLL